MGTTTVQPNMQLSASEVAKTLTSDTTTLAGTGSIFNKTVDTTQATAEHELRDTETKAAQTAALAQAATEAKIKANLVTRPYKRTRAERVLANTQRNLDTFKTAPIGSAARLEAFVKIMDAVERDGTKDLVEMVYKFFLTYRDDAILSPLNALQGISSLEPSTNEKLKLFYDIMLQLANNQANKNRLSIDMIRSVFKNDNFVSWISSKMRHLTRGTTRV